MMSIVPIFAVPLGVVTLPGGSQSNPIIARLLTQRAAANPTPDRSNPLCYQSRDDLLEWNDPSVQQLCGEIIQGLWSAVAAVTSLTPEQLQTLSMHARGAFTIVQPDGCVPAISHALTAWCGIYCVEAPGPSATRSDSGVVRFYESRLGTMLADATTSSLRLPFTSGHYTWRAEPGQLVVFPGSLTHEIPLIKAVGPFTFITVRSRFVGPEQEGLPRW